MEPKTTATPLGEIHAHEPLGATRLYQSVGDIQVFTRHFEIGDYGPDLKDLARISLVEFTARGADLEFRQVHLYINPAWTVMAPPTTDELTFIKEAEKTCIHWMTRLRHTLGYGRVNRMLRGMDPNARTYASCGMLFIAGKEAHPKRLNWRPKKTR